VTSQTILTTWAFDPLVLVSLLVSAVLYLCGVAYTAQRGISARLHWWQITCFYLGLLVVWIALQSEIDLGGAQLLWVHMVQHDLLVMVAPPLLLLGIPTWIMWRAFPASWRRAVLILALRYRWPWRFGQVIGRLATTPALILGIFIGDFLLWHIPFFYDLTLYHANIHIIEHLLFLGTALLFWAQIISTHPQRRMAKHPAQARRHTRRMSYPQQVMYLAAAALAMNILGAIFVFSTGPIYQYYAGLARSPDMPSVVIDQHYAGAAMDVPGTLIFFCDMMIILGLWLLEDERAVEAEATISSYRN
jgi:cytochrome c oxidase assembly factor CtaG